MLIEIIYQIFFSFVIEAAILNLDYLAPTGWLTEKSVRVCLRPRPPEDCHLVVKHVRTVLILILPRSHPPPSLFPSKQTQTNDGGGRERGEEGWKCVSRLFVRIIALCHIPLANDS